MIGLFIEKNFLKDTNIKLDSSRKSTATNTGFASGGVIRQQTDKLCKLGALCFYSSVVLVDSFALPCLLDVVRQGNTPLQQSPKRYRLVKKPVRK